MACEAQVSLFVTSVQRILFNYGNMTFCSESLSMREQDKLLISSLVQQKWICSLQCSTLLFMQYSTDFRSWFVTFSISFTLPAQFSLKFRKSAPNCAEVYSREALSSALIIPCSSMCNSHCDSTMMRYFMRADSEKQVASEAVFDWYLPSRGESALRELNLKKDKEDLIINYKSKYSHIMNKQQPSIAVTKLIIRAFSHIFYINLSIRAVFQRLLLIASSITIYLIPMKNTPANLSRSQLLAWLNSHVEKTIGPVKRIEELGNGVAYVVLVDALRPGTIRTEKMIKYPMNHHEYFHNLKMVAAAFEKLHLQIPIDMERIPMMKFQENYALACAIKKALDPDNNKHPFMRSEKENRNQTNKVALQQRFKVVKGVPPEKTVPPPTAVEKKKEMEEEHDIAKDLEKLCSPQRKLKKIEAVVMEEDVAYKEKLDKIANILNLKRPETNHYKSNNNSNFKPLTIEYSYQRFLRPSLCEKSSFFPKKTTSFEKTERMDILGQGQKLLMSKGRESDGENLLSQIKKENFEKEEKMDIIYPQQEKLDLQDNELKAEDILFSEKKHPEADPQQQPLQNDQNLQQFIASFEGGVQVVESEMGVSEQLLV